MPWGPSGICLPERQIGEVVFNTDMTTSQDLLQDPTYSARSWYKPIQLIGNRGVVR